MEMKTRPDCFAKRIIGMPVYSIQEAQQLGNVKSLLIDNREKRISGIIVERRRFGREERLISFAHIQSVGEDVITVDKSLVAERRNAHPQYMRQARNPINIIGSRVFSVGGKTLGKVDEFRFDSQSGAITALEISGNGGLFKERFLLDGAYIKTIALGTIMVADEALANATPLVNPLLSSVTGTVEMAKEKAGNFFNDTVNATKKFSENLAGNLRKTEDAEAEEEEMAKPITPLEQELEDGLVIRTDTPEEESPSEPLAETGMEEAAEEALEADIPLPVNVQEIVAEDLGEEKENEKTAQNEEARNE